MSSKASRLCALLLWAVLPAATLAASAPATAPPLEPRARLDALVAETLKHAGERSFEHRTDTRFNPPVADDAEALGVARSADEVRALLAAGANPNGNALLGPPLLRQVQATDTLDHSPMMAALLDGGADPNASLQFHGTVLHACAETGKAAAVRLLLDHGADVNAADDQGQTPLLLATMFGAYDVSSRSREILTLLLEHGANPNVKSREGRTPLNQVLEHPELVTILLAHGADPRHVYPDALDLATPLDQSRRRDVQKLLIDAGAGTASQRWLFQRGLDPNLLRLGRMYGYFLLPFAGVLLPLAAALVYLLLFAMLPSWRRAPSRAANAVGAVSVIVWVLLFAVAVTAIAIGIFSWFAGKALELVMPLVSLAAVGVAIWAFRRGRRRYFGRPVEPPAS